MSGAGRPEARFFRSPAELRRWLRAHHRTAPVLWVGFHKKASGRPSVTYPEALDEALCFGWIDGVRRSLGPGSYVIRFTPRRQGSVWSLVNIRRARALERARKMTAAGRAAFQARDEKRARRDSDQRAAARFAPAEEKAFRAERGAWEFFSDQPPGYRRTLTWWVASAKREETRRRRLSRLIEASRRGRRILD